MTGYTHLVGGVASLALPVSLLRLAGADIPSDTLDVAAIGALVGGLLPDLDAPESLLKSFTVPLNPTPARRKRANYLYVAHFTLPAYLLNRTLGHRTLLHSLPGFAFATILVGVPLALWLSPVLAIGLLLGYLSHLALDACTVSGIPLWYPKKQRFRLLPDPL